MGILGTKWGQNLMERHWKIHEKVTSQHKFVGVGKIFSVGQLPILEG
jgi:hypothetical protein